MKISKFTQFTQRFVLGFAVLFTWNVAFAEESGVFLGANFGYGDMTMHTDTTFTEANGDTHPLKGKLASGGGVNYGIIVGYKQFFTPYLGLRYYANLNALHATLSPTALMNRHAGITKKQKITLLNYGANVDFWGILSQIMR